MTTDPRQTIVRSPVEAKQGSNRPRLIYVLVAGLVLVVAAFAVASQFYQH